MQRKSKKQQNGETQTERQEIVENKRNTDRKTRDRREQKRNKTVQQTGIAAS